MKTIWKFPLEIVDAQYVKAPMGARFFKAEIQNDRLCLWGFVDPDQTTFDHAIYIFGTGRPIPDRMGIETLRHIGTVFDGPFVWHVFVRDR